MDAPLFDIPRHSAAHGCTAYRKELGGRSVDAHQCCIVEHVRTDTPARSHVRSAAALRMKNSVRDSLSHVKPSKERQHRVILGFNRLSRTMLVENKMAFPQKLAIATLGMVSAVAIAGAPAAANK
ncbi:hypothetical protein [Burkholderia sp. GbtcB21]|uniref:hypothetical protein n=1 Tax=Burkholderia sp. GbtcB21 TaxID=2824766 RepID=UPI001C306218|nr:hypothetical protein [Burkholderia sp. GbtcB21]